MEELSIPCILNAAASPNFMPIENIFAMAKANFKKLRLNQFMEGKMDNTK